MRIGPVKATPYDWPFDGSVPVERAALICIDWQTDFCGPGGYVDTMGYDIGLTRAGLPATQRMLAHARATGMPVANYLEQRLWQPAGLAAGSWSLDSGRSGFEKMESGVNARTLDFARFGQLMLDGGVAADGRRVLAERTVRMLTSPEGAAPLDHRRPGQYYQLFWWGQRDARWGNAYYAHGKYGQFIFVAPASGVVIARNGSAYGTSPAEWIALFGRMAYELGRSGGVAQR